MEFKNKVEVKFPGIDECYLVANTDCPMGKVYDYACALRSFAVQRMQEEEAKVAVQANLPVADEVKPEETPNPVG